MSLLICEFFQLEMLGLSDQARYIAYLIAQYFIGFSQFGLEICIFILFIELTSSKYSSYVTIFFLNMFGLGEIIIVVSCYLLRNWHYHNLFIATYSFLCTLSISIFLPESPKFLISKKSYKEASIVLSKISKINGNSEITEEIILKELEINKQISVEEIQLLSESKLEVFNDQKTMNEIKEKNDFSAAYFLLHPPTNLSNILLLAHIWFTMSMLFYGINYGNISIIKL